MNLVGNVAFHPKRKRAQKRHEALVHHALVAIENIAMVALRHRLGCGPLQ